MERRKILRRSSFIAMRKINCGESVAAYSIFK
jgi:hypothetical protein